MKKSICLWILAAALLFAAAPVKAAEMTVNKIAAVVNGEIITLHDLRSRTMAELGRRGMTPADPRTEEVMRSVLDSMINDILMRHDAERYKITVSNAEVDEEYNALAQRNRMSPKDFEGYLKTQGSSPEIVKETIKNNLLRQRMVTVMISRKVIVTQEEVKEYYNSHQYEFADVKMVDFSILVFRPEVDVKAVYARLKSGELSFEQGISEYALEKGGPTGGILRRIPWRGLPPNIQELLGAMEPGQVSPVFKYEERDTVVHLDAAPSEQTLSFEEVKDRIESMIREPRLQERFAEYASQLRSKAVVDIRL